MENKDLPNLFIDIIQNWRRIEKEAASIDYKEMIDVTMKANDRIQSLSLFSCNEDIEEVSTKSLKYILMNFFEAEFRLKSHEANPQIVTLKSIMGCLLSYLKILNDYGLACPKKSYPDRRTQKVEVFKRKKEISESMKAYEYCLEDESDDDEIERKYWMNFITFAELISNEHMSMLKRELEMLKMREAGVRPEQPKPRPPTQPFMIAKNEEMKRVFGLGYPSRPVYTVEEFGEKQVELMQQQEREKTRQIAANPPRDNSLELTWAEEDSQRKKDQMWDEHKDTTRRGDGNRKNMG